jgi:hypothetical protein
MKKAAIDYPEALFAWIPGGGLRSYLTAGV